MKPSLQVRFSQHLALTPQLQQSIRLLQLSTLELHQEVEQMLEQNPFLEAEEEIVLPDPAVTTAPALERAAAATSTADDDGGGDHVEAGERADSEATPAVDSIEFGSTERDDWE